MSDEPKLHVRHLRQAKLCMGGGRAWFARRGWSWSDFVSNGRRLQDFRDQKCALADRAVAAAEQEAFDLETRELAGNQ